MEHFLEKLKKSKEHIVLSSARKAEMREELAAFMRGTGALAARPAFFRGPRHFLRPMPILASMLMLVLLSGGTSLAAQNSLPGDALYAVKLLDEEVRAKLALSAEARAEWEAIRAERRLDEVAKLATEGKLTVQLKEELEDRFALHADRVEERIRTMQAEEDFGAAAGLASRFEASLDAHNRILARLDAQSSGRVAVLNDRVAVLRDTAKQSRNEAEAKVEERSASPESRTAAEGKIAAAAKIVSETEAAAPPQVSAPAPEAQMEPADKPENSDTARSFSLEAGMGSASALAPEPPVTAESQALLAIQLLREARAKYEAKQYGEAFRLANEAVKAGHQARVLLKAQKELKLELNFAKPKNDDRKADDRDGENRGGGRIEDFEDCADAGYPVMESFPRQCRTPEGETFTEKTRGIELDLEIDN